MDIQLMPNGDAEIIISIKCYARYNDIWAVLAEENIYSPLVEIYQWEDYCEICCFWRPSANDLLFTWGYNKEQIAQNLAIEITEILQKYYLC